MSLKYLKYFFFYSALQLSECQRPQLSAPPQMVEVKCRLYLFPDV